MEQFKEKDIELLQAIHDTMHHFITSDMQIQELPPSSAYERRLTHHVAKLYQIRTESVGEEERFVCLIRTEQSHIPENMEVIPGDNSNVIYDFGDQVFYAKPGVKVSLFSDGSIGVDHQNKRYLDSKVVTHGDFCIRKNCIVPVNPHDMPLISVDKSDVSS